MNPQVKFLNFDSSLFGYKVGALYINRIEDYKPNELPDDYQLIYVFSSVELPLRLVDRKESYKRSTTSIKNLKEIESVTQHNFNYKNLQRLAFQSGVFSRFYTDHAFKNSEFQKLYSIWFEKSMNLELCWDVLFIKNDSREVGFITLGQVDAETASIGLIAVDEKERGKGYAKLLIQNAINKSFQNGFSEISVVTQGLNKPAVKLYESQEFKLKSTTYIYHIWK
ncbi:GNAT family N-acetyltransferase [Leeuwenhoekiella sp. H156]|uniref:GNAT family N-acetyltransferase n=1 Tax=Leeuwenhoekiella sp. H156 TaxID=3450128 RepID=UPI003FA47D93